MTSNTKAIIDKNKRHILKCYERKGGATQFVKDVDYFMEHNRISPQRAITEYICQWPRLLFENYKIAQYLISLGFDKNRVERDDYDVWDVYTHLMARDGTKLYEDLKKNGVEKTVKALSVKKKEKLPFGL